jgi:ADP-ribose pyrophosphatase YjhB (NUDIX family)
MREQIFVLDKIIELSDETITGFDENTLFIKHHSRQNLKAAYELFYSLAIIKRLHIFHKDFEFLKKDFLSLFDIIEGAGGLVKNTKGEILMIFRNGKWDIPKGKIEKGEKKDVAALREVEEECGISELNIVKELPNTFHIYKLKNKYILKKTYWFLMKSEYAGKLTPQAEEGITKAKWIGKKELNKIIGSSYTSIQNMLLNY